MISPVFEFFEVIADELCSDPSRVITRMALQANKEVSSLLDDLQQELNAATSEEAIERAVEKLKTHFESKSAKLPFTYDAKTGRFEATDPEFLEFVEEMSSIRSVGKRSRSFECNVAKRLGKRATGNIHRVGRPRDHKKRKIDFNRHLHSLGFRRPVLPLGAIPHKPFVSIQCKNGVFSVEEADKSIGAGSRSFAQHGGLQPSVHVPCVLFNDYIYAESLPRKPFNFVPLGLTDLATIDTAASVEMI